MKSEQNVIEWQNKQFKAGKEIRTENQSCFTEFSINCQFSSLKKEEFAKIDSPKEKKYIKVVFRKFHESIYLTDKLLENNHWQKKTIKEEHETPDQNKK